MSGKINWLRILAFIYSITFCFLFVAASVTAYSLSHPELGIVEKGPFTRALILEYGLVGGLLLGLLYNSAIILLFWPLFIYYLKRRGKHKSDYAVSDSIAYSWMSAYGLYLLINGLLNAANDVSWLLFYSCPSVITAKWDFWKNMAIYLMLAIFLVLFPIVYYSMRKEESP